MTKKILNKYEELGLKTRTKEFRLKEFVNKDGEFDYDHYKKTQEIVNRRKITFAGPSKDRLAGIAKHAQQNIPDLKFALCHGTRRGHEQRDFNEILKISVLGTEISPTATEFPNTIEWDFHETKEEWINSVCFIYSNSIDHSYDPIFCLSQWMKCIKPEGKIYLQYNVDQHPDTFMGSRWSASGGIRPDEEFPADAFQGSFKAYTEIVNTAGNGEWEVIKGNFGNCPHLIVQRRKL